MRELASIQRIWKMDPIEGADKIELANVLGWQCVVNKRSIQVKRLISLLENVPDEYREVMRMN